MRRALAILSLAVSVLGCGGPVTQLVLAVDTDLAIPDQIDTILVSVSGPSTTSRMQTVQLRAASGVDGGTPSALPFTVGLVPGSALLGPVTITVTGRSGATPVVSRTVRTAFVSGQSRVLYVRLVRSCIGVCTDSAGGCDENGCVTEPLLDATTLPTLSPPITAPELCNGRDDDGNGTIDDGFDTQNDASHCGACHNVCPAGGGCVAGTCQRRPIVQIAAGATHLCARRESGNVACWGSGDAGQLGNGRFTDEAVPQSVVGLNDAIEIAAGNGFSCAIRRGGSVVCWGSASCGEIGRSGANQPRPVVVANVSNAVRLGLGYCHACAVLASGQVTCWGTNSDGRLGDGTTSTASRGAMPVVGISDAVAVAASKEHTCVLRRTGGVSCFGKGALGRLGNAGNADSSIPVDVQGLPMGGAARVAVGLDFSCAVATTMAMSTTLYCWGNNGGGSVASAKLSIAQPSTVTSSAVALAAAGMPTATELSASSGSCGGCFLDNLGRVSCWGCDDDGQRFLGGAMQAPEPNLLAFSGSMLPFTQVSAGDNFACGLRNDAAVVCWGSNTNKQLGGGAMAMSRVVPVVVTDL